jgi:hypothetical protein
MLPLVEWDSVMLKAFAGIAAVLVSGALLLLGVGCVVRMMGLIAGVAVMHGPASNSANSVSRLPKRRLASMSP